MQVRQLIARLQKLDQDAEVIVDLGGEFRVLNPEDLAPEDLTDLDHETDDGVVLDGPVVRISSWA